MRSKEKSPKKQKKLRVWLAALILFTLVILGFGVAALISTGQNDTITVASYTFASPKIKNGFRAVMVSDLHRKVFGEDNQPLVDAVASQEPDIICVNGDMLERNHTKEEDEAYRSLLERFMEIAPVYFSAGNHDYITYFQRVLYIDLDFYGRIGRSKTLDLLESTGAVFLEYDHRDIVINGDSVRIGGFYPQAYKTDEDFYESWNIRRVYLEKYCDTDSFKLLMSHTPDAFIFGDAGNAWDIDLVLSGHTHNGVIATPFSHRAVFTAEGLFPEHARGQFDLGSVNMIIGGGLAGWNKIPRVFNPPEIVTVDIVPA